MLRLKQGRTSLGLTAVIALWLSITVAPTALADSQEQEYDMNDRFAFEKGASGSGKLSVHKDSIKVAVKAEGLIPKHEYEMKLTIGDPDDAPVAGDPVVVTCGPKTSSSSGKLRIRCTIDLLDFLAPGTYRVDIFLTHIHSTDPAGDPDGELLAVVLGRDPLLACQPATTVMVPE
jgi:hypothetical protein